MDGAVLQRFIEEWRRIDNRAEADLVAFRRGLLSVDEAISRGLGRQFERRCLSLRITALTPTLSQREREEDGGRGEGKEEAPARVEAATRA